MRIQYASDLHLEFEQNQRYIGRDGIKPLGDVLVLAGDVSYLGDKNMMKWPFWDWCAEHYQETFIIPGNHEFYGGYDIGCTMDDYVLEVRPNVRYMNNRSVVIGDVELFFTTLWTRINPVRLWTIQCGMNDFHLGVLNGKRFSASEVDELHQHCMDWLTGALAVSSAKHKIVVSHHCPTMRPAFNGFPGSVLNTAFQVDLDVFIENSDIEYWIYGHTHFGGGSGTKVGGTILLCNQLGYVFQDEQLRGYEPDAIIEVGAETDYNAFVNRQKMLGRWPFEDNDERKAAWEEWKLLSKYNVGE